MRIFIDSNIFVYAAQAHPKFGGMCKRVIKDIEDRKLSAITSSLNISEVGEVVDRHVGKNESIKVLELLLALPLEIEPIVKEHLIMALEFFNKYGINYFDCIFAAVMKEKFIDTIITNDAHFENVEGIKVIKPKEY